MSALLRVCAGGVAVGLCCLPLGVLVAQQATDPTPSEMAEFRKNIDKASGRIRGLQATVVEHEKNIEAIKKELGALKP